MNDIFSISQQLINGNSFYNTDKYLKAQSFYDYPILTKATVSPYYNSCTCAGENYKIFYTSGSSGTPMRITWRKADYFKSIADLWRLRAKQGVTPNDVCLTCHSGLANKRSLLNEPIYTYGKNLSLSKLHFTTEHINDYINYINIFSPTWIYAQPSFVYQLGICLLQYAPDYLIHFKYIELVGEMVDPLVKKHIQEIFSSAIVISMYGLQEFNAVMYENADIMIECSNNAFVEILDDDNHPCEIGQVGNIVVTGLKNTLLPLIRYNTEDKGKKVIVAGKEGFIITQGRSNDAYIYNNQIYDGSIFFNVITKYNLTHLKQISKFQVLQKKSLLIFQVFGFDGLPNKTEIENDINAILYIDYNIHCQIKVVIVDNLNNLIHGEEKTKYFLRLM